MAGVETPELATRRRQSRIIYAVLVALMAIFLLRDLPLPFVVGPQARALYEAVERVPDDKLVLVSLTWSAGTIGENYPQTEALIQHLFMSGKRVAIFGIDPVGPTFGQQIAERHAARLGRVYGEHWVNFGYRPPQLPMILGLAKDIPGTIQRDINGTPLTELPVMEGINDATDLGMILEVTPTASVEMWIQFFHGVYGTPVGYAPTAVMVPEAYPYLHARQIVGMLAGIKGAAEYAALLAERPGAELTWMYPPARAMNAVSIAHVMIVVLILIGNYMHFSRSRRPEVRS